MQFCQSYVMVSSTSTIIGVNLISLQLCVHEMLKIVCENGKKCFKMWGLLIDDSRAIASFD